MTLLSNASGRRVVACMKLKMCTSVHQAWEKSAATDSAEPNSKEILLRLRQLFVDAKFLSTPGFCRRLYFVDASILSTRYFVDTNVLSTPIIFSTRIFLSPPIILLTRIFCRCKYFVAANIFDFLFRLTMIIWSNDCVLCIS